MNRYDTASVAKFSPLSFNELAAAPTMMRQKHDASIAAAEAMRINADPYSKHYTRALELKNQMDNEIAKNVDTLNKEGYNPTTFQNITRLNRQYQDLMSPTGEIGQINAENVNIKKINEEYDKLGKEKNWGQNTIDYWKNKALKEYNEKPIYDADGRILKYNGPEGIANKIDYNKRLHELASSAKMSVSDFSNAVTKLEMDERSGYNVANKNSEAHKLGDNYPGVKAAYDTLKREMYDPTSEVYKSMRYEGRDPNSLLDILKTQSDIYKQNVKSDEYSNDKTPFGPGPSAGGDGSGVPGGGKIISGESKIEASSVSDSYSTPLNEIKTLSTKIASGKGTTADKIRRDELIELRRIADSKLVNDPKYNNLQSKFLQKQNEIKKYQDKYFTNQNGNLKRKNNASGNFVEIKLNNLKTELNNISRERSKIKDNAWNNSSKVINTYNYIPTTVTEANDFENFNLQAGNILSNVKNIDNILDIVNVSQDDDNYSKVTPNHTKALTAAMKNADPKSFSISNPTPSGPGGRPQVTITFTTRKGTNASDIDDSGKFRDDTLGGDEKTISFVANLKNSKDNPTSADMIGSFSKHLRDYYGGKGDVISQGVGAGLKSGDHLKNAMIYNQYKGNTVEELSRAAYSTDGKIVQMKDEDAFNILAGKAAKKGMRVDDYIRYYGKEKI